MSVRRFQFFRKGSGSGSGVGPGVLVREVVEREEGREEELSGTRGLRTTFLRRKRGTSQGTCETRSVSSSLFGVPVMVRTPGW